MTSDDFTPASSAAQCSSEEPTIASVGGRLTKPRTNFHHTPSTHPGVDPTRQALMAKSRIHHNESPTNIPHNQTQS